MNEGPFIGLVAIGVATVVFGIYGLITTKTESADARAVRAFFKAYTDDTRVSYTRPAADGSADWVIDVRSLSDKDKAYTAVPIDLLMKLSADTGMVEPWPDIIIDPIKPALIRSSPHSTQPPRRTRNERD